MWHASRHQYGAGAPRALARRPRRGLSLFEAVAALAIVGATATGALSAAGAGTRTAARARHAHEAEALMQELHAKLSLTRDLLPLPDSLVRGRFEVPFDDYTFETEVRTSVAVPGLYEVRMTVEWDGGAQEVHTVLYRGSTPSTAATP